jgi:hypothetical protein
MWHGLIGRVDWPEENSAVFYWLQGPRRRMWAEAVFV